MITADVFGAAVPACPAEQIYSRTQQKCVAPTGSVTTKPTCPEGQSLNPTTKVCEKTAPPKGEVRVIGPDGLPVSCAEGQVYSPSVGCRAQTDAKAAALAQTTADQAAIRAAIAGGKPTPIRTVIRIHNYVLTAAEAAAFAKVVAKAKAKVVQATSSGGTPGAYTPTGPKLMLGARFTLYWPESGTAPIVVGKENTTDAHWLIERFENPNGKPFTKKFSDGVTITFGDETPPVWAKFWNPKTKLLQIGPQPKDNSTFFSGHVTKYGWGDFWDDLKAVVCPAGLIMSAIPVTTAAGVAITTGCAVAAAVEAATSSGNGAGTRTEPAKTEPVVAPKYPPGTITAFDPSTNLWRIAIPRGATLGDFGQEANTHVEVATSATVPVDPKTGVAIPQVTIIIYNVTIGAAAPWYKSWWFWGIVGVTTATVIGVVIYKRRRTTA